MGGDQPGGVEAAVVGGLVVRGPQHHQLPLSLLGQEGVGPLTGGGEVARLVFSQDVGSEELLVQAGAGPGEPQVGQANRQALQSSPLQQRGVVGLVGER